MEKPKNDNKIGPTLKERIKLGREVCTNHFDSYLSYKQKSLESLIDALDIVFALIESMRSKPEEISQLDEILKSDQHITVQSNTSLELKCIKLVYDFPKGSEDRLRKWARVLIAAHQNGQDSNSFKFWLKDVGGVKAAAELANIVPVSGTQPAIGATEAITEVSTEDNPEALENTSTEYNENTETSADSLSSLESNDTVLGEGELLEKPENVIPGLYVQLVSMESDGRFKVLLSSFDKKLVDHVCSKLASNDNVSENEQRALAEMNAAGG